MARFILCVTKSVYTLGNTTELEFSSIPVGAVSSSAYSVHKKMSRSSMFSPAPVIQPENLPPYVTLITQVKENTAILPKEKLYCEIKLGKSCLSRVV